MQLPKMLGRDYAAPRPIKTKSPSHVVGKWNLTLRNKNPNCEINVKQMNLHRPKPAVKWKKRSHSPRRGSNFSMRLKPMSSKAVSEPKSIPY